MNASEVTLTTVRGNVKAKLRGKATDYRTAVTVEKGRCNVDPSETGTKTLNLNVSGGNVHIDFEGE